MRGRLSEAVGSVGEVLGHDDGLLALIRDCVRWIVHLIYNVFDSVVHFIGEICKSIWNNLGPGFQDAAATVWGHIRDGAIYIYEGIVSVVERLVDACDDNSTCSSVARKTKDFAEYWFEQFTENIGFGSLVMCTAAAVVLYFCWSRIVGCLYWCYNTLYVLIVRCCGFRQRGIKARTPASSYMRTYGGYVPSSSRCATYQSIGVTGAVYDDYYDAYDVEQTGSKSGGCCRGFLVFAFVVVGLYFALLFVTHNDDH